MEPYGCSKPEPKIGTEIRAYQSDRRQDRFLDSASGSYKTSHHYISSQPVTKHERRHNDKKETKLCSLVGPLESAHQLSTY